MRRLSTTALMADGCMRPWPCHERMENQSDTPVPVPFNSCLFYRRLFGGLFIMNLTFEFNRMY